MRALVQILDSYALATQRELRAELPDRHRATDATLGMQHGQGGGRCNTSSSACACRQRLNERCHAGW
jgi:hypothetical protein